MINPLFSSIVLSEVETNQLDNELNGLFNGLTIKEQEYVVYFSTFDRKTYKYPDQYSNNINLDLSKQELFEYLNNTNIWSKIYTIRGVVSNVFGKYAIREGIGFKARRLKVLNDTFDSLEKIVEERKEEVQKLILLKDKLKTRYEKYLESDDPEKQIKAVSIYSKIIGIEEKLIPGKGTGYMKENGDIDIGLITEQRKLLTDIAKEFGDDFAENKENQEPTKVYSDSTKGLINVSVTTNNI
jgi:hypothetical protein